jgi:endonuclease/exonuclease/phosphatase family metal-dependent hydrolase
MRLKLLTWNVHGLPFAHRSSAKLAKYVAERDADVILLQEAWTRALDRSLLAALPGYGHSYTPIRGHFFRAGGLLALVRSSVFTVDDATFQPFFCQGPAWKFWEADGLGEKGFQRLDLTHKPTGQKLTVFNTHRQMAQIDRIAASIAPDAVVIAGGDYNTQPSEPIKPGLPLWDDLTANVQPGQTTHDKYWIDYVFARRRANNPITATIAPLDSAALNLSDHKPLFATIDVPAAAARSAAALVSVGAAIASRPHDRRQFLFAAALAAAGLLAGGGTQAA